MRPPRRWVGVAALLLLSLTLATTLQVYVGLPVLYTPESWAWAERLHYAILRNQPPEGTTWIDLGAGGTNHRVLVPFIAEAAHAATGAPLQAVYFWIDGASLFALFPFLFLYLRRWLSVAWCLAGVLFLAAVLPSTYHFFYFHPWDRPSALCWLGALWLIRARQPLALAAVLAVGTLVKFDVLFLPLLYAAVAWNDGDRRRTAAWTAVLMGSTLSVFVLLTALRPGSGAGQYYATQMATLAGNLQELWQYHLRHPAVLMLLLPALGAALYRPGPDQQDQPFLRWLAPFALAHLPIYLLLTLFRESRALVPFVIVVLPPALLALQERMEVAGEGNGP